MSSYTEQGAVIRVFKKGQATIPKELREEFGIETPGKVLIHKEEGKIVVEPLPPVEEMQGVHADRYERGEVRNHLQDMEAADKRLERERNEEFGRHQ